MKNFTKAIGFIIALTATSAQAIPTLFFDGTITYTKSATTNDPGMLSVSSSITSTFEIANPLIQGGSIDFSAMLTDVTNTTNLFGTTIIGSFGTVSGSEDMTVLDINSDVLFTGNFDNLVLRGRDDDLSGVVSGIINATVASGSLANLFGAGNVIALEFNLSTPFETEMFNGDFNGLIDGRIEGEAITVSEPTILGVFGLGTLLVGFGTKVNNRRVRINS